MSLHAFRMCRICEMSDSLKNLLQPHNERYAELYVACADVQFDIDDCLPKYLCQTCITNLNRWFTFKQQCEYAYKKLSSPSYLPSTLCSSSPNWPKSTASSVSTTVPLRQEIILIKESIQSKYMTEEEETAKDALPEQSVFADRLSTSFENAFTLPNIVRTYSKRQPSIVIRQIQVDNSIDVDAAARNGTTVSKKTKKLAGNIKAAPKEQKQLSAKYQCTKCLRNFVSSVNLRRHMEWHDAPKKQHKCDVCHRFFISTFTLERHISNVHRQERPFVCDICGKTFKQDFILKTHINEKHTKKLTYKCDLCTDQFTTSVNLVNHRRKKHPATVHRRKRTNLNGMAVTKASGTRRTDTQWHSHRLKRKYARNLHNNNVRRHRDKNYELLGLELQSLCCKYCGEMQPNSQVLADHEHGHIDDGKRYKCDVCGFWAKRLPLHRLKHTDLPRPFQCATCERKFWFRNQLKLHERLHKKRYTCHMCDKSLANAVNLKVHVRMHTGERPYRCAECGERFISTAKRAMHGRKTNHNIKAE